MQISLILFKLGMTVGFFSYIWLVVVAFKRHVGWGLAVLLTAPISTIAPASAAIFAATNWYSAKKAFLVYIGSWAMMVAGVIGVFSVYAPMFNQTMLRVEKGQLTQDEAGRQFAIAIMSGKTSLPPLPKEQSTDNPQQDSASGPAANGTQSAGKTETSTQNTDQPSVDAGTSGQNNQSGTQQVPKLSQVEPDPLAQKRAHPSDKVDVRLSDISKYTGRFFIITMKNGNQHRGILRKLETSQLVLDRKLYGGSFIFRVNKDQIKTIQMLKREPAE